MPDKNNSLADLTYEQAFSELETIVEALENEQKPLDETLKLFERGQMLTQYCAALLEQAELRIKQLDPSLKLSEKDE